jgi:retinol dehydrogenase 12
MPPRLSIMFPPEPTFKPEHLPSLAGKVFIITGAASGVGFELAKILYAAGGTVYIGARSTARCSDAIEKIRSSAVVKNNAAAQKGQGKLGSMVIDLADLATVRGAVKQFLQDEMRLDGLVHNAGVMMPPAGSTDKLVGRSWFHLLPFSG